MKKIVVLLILFGSAWYGVNLYKLERLPFQQNFSSVQPNIATKCITKDGEIIYGDVPEGTTCEKTLAVNGSLTIVDSSFFKSNGEGALINEKGTPGFRCDGRIFCSQMRSCEEAIFFLRNCPNVKMDGNNDGVPCESQWCK